jgi:hypothetical protein
MNGIVHARIMGSWTYQQLLDKSDLVVIATPTATNDTKEAMALPTYLAMRVVGVETTFAISAVVKGDRSLKQFVFHHYRAEKPDGSYPNGPNLVTFNTTKKQVFLIFLVREPDGRYSPTSGQTDPGYFAVHALEGNIE